MAYFLDHPVYNATIVQYTIQFTVVPIATQGQRSSILPSLHDASPRGHQRRLHGARRGGTCPPPTFTNGWTRGAPRVEKQLRETDQTVLTTTKALTKTTNCTCRAKKVEGHDKKFSDVLPPTFKFVPAPLYTRGVSYLCQFLMPVMWLATQLHCINFMPWICEASTAEWCFLLTIRGDATCPSGPQDDSNNVSAQCVPLHNGGK